MPRPLRFEFHDAWYHVMNRGAGFRNIYPSNKFRQTFLDLLGEASKLCGIEIHGYCLMDNHYHLLIKTPFPNLSRAMRHINGVYTQRLNRLRKTDGPLFRGRYKAIVISKDNYLLQVSRYIHLNPIAAHISQKPEEYAWSSYQHYLYPFQKPNWLHTNEILSMLNCNNQILAYTEFIAEGIDLQTRNFYDTTNPAAVFSNDHFKDTLLRELKPETISAAKSDYNRICKLPRMKNICFVCAQHFGIDIKEIYFSRRGEENLPRKIAIFGCRLWSGAATSVIAKHFRFKSPSYVATVVSEIHMLLKTQTKLREIINTIELELTR
jgi:putative transposase